jgi:hypothetical protein
MLKAIVVSIESGIVLLPDFSVQFNYRCTSMVSYFLVQEGNEVAVLEIVEVRMIGP